MINENEIYKKLLQQLYECSSLLERTEACKYNVREFIEKLFSDSDISLFSKVKYFEEAWKLYISYDDELIPQALENIRTVNDLIKNFT